MADGDGYPVCADLMQMRPIGCLQSVFQFKNGTPRQPSLCGAARGSLTVDKNIFNNPEHALEGLQQFSHAWIIFVFHKNRPGHTKAKVKPPRLNGKRMGVFSTRSPYRPNAIGLTLAKIERISGATVHFSGIDIVDGTPVLDIKPFIPQYDVPECRGESFIGDGCSAGSSENCALNDDTHTVDFVVTDLETVSSNPQACEFRHENSSPAIFAEKSTEYTRTAKQEGICTAEGESNDGHAESSINRTEETTQKSNHAGTLSLVSPESFPGSCSQTEEPVSVERSSASGEERTVVSSQHTFPGSCSQTEEPVSVERSSASGEERTVVSSQHTSSSASGEERTVVSSQHTSSSASGEERTVVSSQHTNMHNKSEQKINTHLGTNHQACNEKGGNSFGAPEESLSSTEEKRTSRISSTEQKQTLTVSQPLTEHSDSSSCNTTVAPWLAAPPVTKLCVSFTLAAEAQLQKFQTEDSPNNDNQYRLQYLSGGEEVRAAIVSVLAEDPRSVYRREKCSDSLYFFTVDQVHVTCWFDDRENRVEVVRLQPVSFVEKLVKEA